MKFGSNEKMKIIFIIWIIVVHLMQWSQCLHLQVDFNLKYCSQNNNQWNWTHWMQTESFFIIIHQHQYQSWVGNLITTNDFTTVAPSFSFVHSILFRCWAAMGTGVSTVSTIYAHKICIFAHYFIYQKVYAFRACSGGTMQCFNCT